MCLVENFHVLRQRLAASVGVEILAWTDCPPPDDDATEKMLQDYLRYDIGFQSPEAFNGCFAVSCGLGLRYVFSFGNGISGGGEFSLLALDSVLSSTKDPELWNPSLPSDEIELLKGFRILDNHPWSGDGKLAAFSLQAGDSPPNIPDIYFFDRGKYYKMNLDYRGYLQALIDLAGIYNWQYLYCDVDFNDTWHSYYRDDLVRSIAGLKMVFPERDFEPYLQRLVWNENSDVNIAQ